MNTEARINSELEQIAEEHGRGEARMAELQATAEDWSLDRSVRLIAQMQVDKIIWKQRSRVDDRTDPEPDKLTLSKRRDEVRRTVRKRAARVAAGLKVRKPRKGKPSGTMAAGERVDGFMATDGKCIVCGKGHERIRSRTCSPACQRAIRAARRASAQPASALIAPPRLPQDTP